jgi:predicted transcriptional regulator
VESYLDYQRRFRAMVEEGLEDMRTGKSFTHEEVGPMIDEWSRDAQSNVS